MEKILNPKANEKKRATKEACERFEERFGAHLPFNCHMSFLGRTKSGKSVACRAMIERYYKNHFHQGYVVSPTCDFEPWSECFPKLFPPENTYNSSNEETIMKVLKGIKSDFEHGNGQYQPYEMQTLLILDDLAKGLWSMNSFSSELQRARHFGCSIFILAQSPMFLNSAQREACWASSISPDFTSKRELEKICFGKNLEAYRTKTTPANLPTLAECFKKVEKLNKERGNRYGRFFFSQCSGIREFFYQNADRLEVLFPNGIDVSEDKPKKQEAKPEKQEKQKTKKKEIPDETYSSDEY